jgi:hypothetical protein
LIESLISLAISDSEVASRAALRLFVAVKLDLSFLFPALAAALRPETADLCALLLYSQISFLRPEPELFEWVWRLIECGELHAWATVHDAIERVIETGCADWIAGFSSPMWIEHFAEIMHNGEYVVPVMQGFEIGALILPHVGAGEMDLLFDSKLIEEELSSSVPLRTHPAVLRFLARAIAYWPLVIEEILESSRGRVGIMDQILRLAEDDRFEVREAAADAFIAFARYGSAAQLREVPPNYGVGLLLQMVSVVDGEGLIDGLAAIVRAWMVDGGYDIEEIFAVHGGHQVLGMMADGECTEVAEAAGELLARIRQSGGRRK